LTALDIENQPRFHFLRGMNLLVVLIRAGFLGIGSQQFVASGPFGIRAPDARSGFCACAGSWTACASLGFPHKGTVFIRVELIFGDKAFWSFSPPATSRN